MVEPSQKVPLHTYTWKGLDYKGIKDEGIIDATSARLARMLLQRRGIKVTNLKKETTSLFGGKKIKVRDVSVFTRQLSTLIEGGIPLAQALSSVGESSDNTAVKKLLRILRTRVESGDDLTTAMRGYPKQFDPLYIGLVNVGEHSGTLGLMLRRIASYLEKSAALKRKVISALMYPVIVFFVGMFIVAGLLIFIIPKFQDLFASVGSDLPALTQAVVSLSEFIHANWLFILFIIVLSVILFRQLYRRLPTVHLLVDRIVLNIPVFGELIRKSILSRVARTIAIMFRAGIPMVRTLGTIAPAAGNMLYTRTLEQVRTDVSTGEPLAAALRNSGQFPNLILQMVKTGEETGEMDNMLDRAADYYEEEVDNSVSIISSLVEPIMVVILGALIGIVVIAMYLPIFKLGSAF